MSRAFHRLVLLAIAVATIISGAVQMIAPSFVLGVVKAEQTATSQHFFGIVGMFMILFGALMWQALRASTPQPIAIRWAAWQKLGAAAAVGIGSYNGIFHSSFALVVAAFDLITAVLAFWWLIRLKKEGSEA